MPLLVCRNCQRHVKRADSVCPFCGRSMPSRAGHLEAHGTIIGLGMGLVLGSCELGAALYAAPDPGVPTSIPTDAASPDGGDGALADQASADAPDAAEDAPGNACGDAACQPGQACVLITGGPAPRCQATEDGGCPAGLVYASFCSSSGVQLSPGCTDPPPAPGCVDLADGCTDLCACLCGSPGGSACSVIPGQYVMCARP
jgi:hypothetical protein